jgi:hypothetical protein
MSPAIVVADPGAAQPCRSRIAATLSVAVAALPIVVVVSQIGGARRRIRQVVDGRWESREQGSAQ